MRCILYVDHSPRIGGATRVLLTTLAALDRTRFEAAVACAPGPVADAVAAAGAFAVPMVMPALTFSGGPRALVEMAARYTATVWRLDRLVRRRRVSAIYAHGLASALFAAPVARVRQIPLVWHVHEMYDDRPRMRPLVAFASRSSRAIVAVSNAAAARLARLGVPPERCTIAPNANPLPLAEGETARPAPEPHLVVAVGALTPGKGHATLVESMALVARAVPEARLEIAGEPLLPEDERYAERLDARIDALGLRASVRLVGFQPDVPALLARAALVVHPSSSEESFGLVPLEAMAAGLPVVATRVGALPDVVDPECGVLVPPGEAVPLADAIIALLRDPARRKAMGAAGRLAATRRFSLDRMIAPLNAAFDRGLGEKPFLPPTPGA